MLYLYPLFFPRAILHQDSLPCHNLITQDHQLGKLLWSANISLLSLQKQEHNIQIRTYLPCFSCRNHATKTATATTRSHHHQHSPICTNKPYANDFHLNVTVPFMSCMITDGTKTIHPASHLDLNVLCGTLCWTHKNPLS